MVEYINLVIPPCADVDNPLEDAAFLARIGANEICEIPNWFELENAVTGTRFTFEWYNNIEDSGLSFSTCSLLREENIFGNFISTVYTF